MRKIWSIILVLGLSIPALLGLGTAAGQAGSTATSTGMAMWLDALDIEGSLGAAS